MGTDSYFNNEQIQIGDIKIMTPVYGSSGSFGSWVRYKSIENNTYTYRISDFCSKPTPIHETVHKSDLNYSYSKSHFSRLLRAVAKKLINCLSKKVSYFLKVIDPVIIEFCHNYVSGNLYICDHSILTFGIRET